MGVARVTAGVWRGFRAEFFQGVCILYANRSTKTGGGVAACPQVKGDIDFMYPGSCVYVWPVLGSALHCLHSMPLLRLPTVTDGKAFP